MKLSKTIFLAALVVIFTVPAMARHWQHPVIKKYGGVVDYKDAVLKPKKDQQHKILFHITTDKKKDGVNVTLWHLARLVNLFGLTDVPTKNVDIVAAVSGPATDLVMTNDTYRKRHGQYNPDMPLMKALSDYGVKICLLCLLKCPQGITSFI